ncbi:MAG TPA: cyclic nucleotide-binding domain-containing protein [Thermoanaerobaculia bacterium]|nr:cyclic nucleotide-binding domain-containing protein [Thermoanaerobaculia bacterium]
MTRHSLELVIVGSGPAGLSAAARAQESGLSYVVLERADHLADTIHSYQKRKHVMAEPGLVPLRSELPFAAGSRESILDGWARLVKERGIDVRFRQEMTGLEAREGGFLVRTATDEYEAKNVVLAIGTQGNPRRLGAPGEDLPHVVTRLIDPDEFQDRDLAVVGAGDSALEIALALAERNRVKLIVRSPEIDRAKASLEREVLSRQATGAMEIFFGTTVARVEPREMELATPNGPRRVPADQVFLKLGATAPRKLLESFGVRFGGDGPEAKPTLDHRYQSTVPGLYLIGAMTGRDLIKLGANQGYEVVEHILGRPVEPADEQVLRSRLPFGTGSVRERIAALMGTIPFFEAAGEEAVREVLLSTEVLTPKDGEVILKKDDYSNTFLVIESGRVGISVPATGGGGPKQIATLGEGDFFGEMSLISNRRRSATATAVGGARLFEIARKAMLKLLATAPPARAMIDRAFLLRAIQAYLFPDVAADVLWPLCEQAKIVQLKKGETLFSEGEPGDAMYLIRTGGVKVAKSSAGRREVVLSYQVAGTYIGEAALLSGAPRSATVTALFPSVLIRLDKKDFDAFLAAQPQLRAGLEQTVEKRRVAALVAESAPEEGDILSNFMQGEVVMGTDVLVIDEQKCVRCDNCIRACEGVHDDGQARLSLTGDHYYNLLVPNSCMQCANPLCMLDCPPDAIGRDPHGEVFIRSNCIGCGNCERNCPYGNIFMVHPKREPSLVTWIRALFGGAERPSDQTVAVKCDLCREIAGGPACVRSCPTGAAIRVNPARGMSQMIDERALSAQGDG